MDSVVVVEEVVHEAAIPLNLTDMKYLIPNTVDHKLGAMTVNGDVVPSIVPSASVVPAALYSSDDTLSTQGEQDTPVC